MSNEPDENVFLGMIKFEIIMVLSFFLPTLAYEYMENISILVIFQILINSLAYLASWLASTLIIPSCFLSTMGVTAPGWT
jgi:hypothetical protein